MNKVVLIGRVGKTPETNIVGENGKKVTKFSIATTEYFGKENKETTWHNLTVWDNYGEVMGKLIKTGSQIMAEGRIQNNAYEKDGVKCVSTNIIVEKIELLDKRTDSTDNAQETADTSSTNTVVKPIKQVNNVPQSQSEDDLPF